jgi:hypothetical protein
VCSSDLSHEFSFFAFIIRLDGPNWLIMNAKKLNS